jgi:hypothetical protein
MRSKIFGFKSWFVNLFKRKKKVLPSALTPDKEPNEEVKTNE